MRDSYFFRHLVAQSFEKVSSSYIRMLDRFVLNGVGQLALGSTNRRVIGFLSEERRQKGKPREEV